VALIDSECHSMANFVQGEYLWSSVLQSDLKRRPRRAVQALKPFRRQAPLTPIGERHAEVSLSPAGIARWPSTPPTMLREALSMPAIHSRNPLTHVAARASGAPILISARDPNGRMRMKLLTRPGTQGGWRAASATNSAFPYMNAHGEFAADRLRPLMFGASDQARACEEPHVTTLSPSGLQTANR